MDTSLLYTAISFLIVLSAVLFISVNILKSNRKNFEQKKTKIETNAKKNDPTYGEKKEPDERQDSSFIPSSEK